MLFGSRLRPREISGIFALGLTAFSPASLAQSSDSIVPMCEGLTIVTAISRPEGDYESIKTIRSIDATEVRIHYSSEAPNTDWLSTSTETTVRHDIDRTVLTADLVSANKYQQVFLDDSAELIPGTTSIGTSADVLRSLRSGQETEFSYSNIPSQDYAGLTADPAIYPNYYSFMTPVKLQPQGRTTIIVLLNDRPAELPVIHAGSEHYGERSEFFFLDDENNPLTLAFRIGIGAIKPMDPAMAETCKLLEEAGNNPYRNQCLPDGADASSLKVIKITHRCDSRSPGSPSGSGDVPAGDLPAPDGSGASSGGGAGSALEQALAEEGRAEVYSIYFEFNSDEIREESEQTLAEIADILNRHADWRLAVEGHTDSIDSDEYNLDLSRRRAAAVKAALVDRYAIDGARLSTDGFGESRPVDTNDTIEGRARNRRVELARLP